MRKKKILFHSNSSRAKTGFGRNARTLLTYLAKTKKYEIVEYSASVRWGDTSLVNMPWKTYGCLPPDEEIKKYSQDPTLLKAIAYGAQYIDEIVKIEKPDIYLGVEDIWGFTGRWNKIWWNKISSILHVTLDSLPILSIAKEGAAKTENFYVWAEFAKTKMNELGYSNVKKMYGAFDIKSFKRLSDEKRKSLRIKNGIIDGAFIIGFVFRNQLRKSLPQLLDGFKLFQAKNPNAYLLLHTCWHEDKSRSWNIPQLIDEAGIDNNKILTTHICRRCGAYSVKPFAGEATNCQSCGEKQSVFTTSSSIGVTEIELNEIYNFMDVYCHPFTSGGQEMPIQEAKLNELITLVTNYSCGEEYCTKESGGLPLDWSPYKEPQTQFIKATTLAGSINEQLQKVYDMSPAQRSKIGKRAKKFTVENFDINVIGPKWEKLFDELPYVVNSDSFKQEDYE